jgi:hypothetical protein
VSIELALSAADFVWDVLGIILACLVVIVLGTWSMVITIEWLAKQFNLVKEFVHFLYCKRAGKIPAMPEEEPPMPPPPAMTESEVRFMMGPRHKYDMIMTVIDSCRELTVEVTFYPEFSQAVHTFITAGETVLDQIIKDHELEEVLRAEDTARRKAEELKRAEGNLRQAENQLKRAQVHWDDLQGENHV